MSSRITLKDHVTAIEAEAQRILNRCHHFKDDIGCIEAGLHFASPTGRPARGVDDWGEGGFGAPRDSRLHEGTDFICEPGQDVVMPINAGLVVRESRPYAEGEYSGLLIRNKWIALKLWYFAPDLVLVGNEVHMGKRIGVAQNIAIKYPGMVPHVHVQCVGLDMEVLL